MIVDIFIPCFIDQFYPSVAQNMVKLLEKVGCAVNYNPDQTCCGQPAYNAGYLKECREVSEKFIHDFQNDRYIVTPSASCSGFVKNYYSNMFTNSALHNECRQIQRNMYEVTDFLVNVLKITDLGATLNGVATYHDSCAGLREYGIKREPRVLLEKVRGLELKELDRSESCCGFGGTFSTKFEPLAVAMAEQKIEDAEDKGAAFLISTDQSCLMHLGGYIKKQEKPIKVMHIVDVLTSGW